MGPAEHPTLPSARTVCAPGTWSDASAWVTLPFDERFRRRWRLETDAGWALLLDLGEATVLREGSALRLDDGRLVGVHAAAEPLLEVRGAPDDLMRVAWHLGNRHLPVQLHPGRLTIRRDHVIAEMLAGLGAKVTEIEAPFDPEGGAYGHHHD